MVLTERGAPAAEDAPEAVARAEGIAVSAAEGRECLDKASRGAFFPQQGPL